MKYISTRDHSAHPQRVTAAEAIKKGLCEDGGLFVPDEIPKLTHGDVERLIGMTYPQRAAYVLSLYLPDYDPTTLEGDCHTAYAHDRFPGGAAPLYPLSDDFYSLELWHGPTCAFKDMALQLMPRLLSSALRMTGERETAYILVATSGDTGKAALEGYRDVDGVKIAVFYPNDGVSPMQKRQMCTQEGNNTYVCAVRGNFDDAQTGVKKIFADPALAKKAHDHGFFFSSANSINWGRLVPQIVYYISSYCDLCASGEIELGDKVNIAVPTGNFGNIFAAYLAMRMGLPVNRFICASNSNNVLTDFINTGVYDRTREFYKTISPSMDILVSSNLERLIYTLGGAEMTKDLMEQLSRKGKYTAPDSLMFEIRKYFSAYSLDEDETKEEIRETWKGDGYLIDPHTAVGLGCVRKFRLDTGDVKKTILASTASPYKFAPAVCDAIGCPTDDSIFKTLSALSAKTGTEIPTPLSSAEKLDVRFTEVIRKDEMADLVFRV